MDQKAFRAELLKIMPGYKWTVQRASKDAVRLTATGIMSSGFNRLSTLQVIRYERGDHVSYTARSASHGTRAVWAHTNTDGTLARALRGLQDHYQAKAATYHSLAARLESGRVAKALGQEGGAL